MSLRVAWGLQPPESAAVAWGARAIYTLTTNARGKREAFIDLLPNRQDWQGAEELRKSLDAVLDGLLATLRERCVADDLGIDADRTLVVEANGYILVAKPRRSYGYLYLGAWPAPLRSVP